MKNTIKVFGIIALVAVIGFSMSACDDTPEDSPESQITFTNASALNGKRVMGEVYGPDTGIDGNYMLFCAGQPSGQSADGVLVSGGTVTLKVYISPGSQPFTFTPYTGNHTVAVGKLYLSRLTGTGITDVGQVWGSQRDDIYNNTVAITFSNGVATVNLSTQMTNDD